MKEKDTATSFVFISPQEHFTQLLKEACDHHGISIQPHSEVYLVQLLQNYITANNLFQFNDHLDSDQKPFSTFAEIYLTALNSDEPKSRKLMKTVADRSLYLTGFFSESLNKKAVDIDYYMNIGSSAYAHLSVWAKADAMSHIYKSLSNKFIQCVDILSYISEKSQLQSQTDVLFLYEKYLKTGSKLAQSKLNELGVTTLPKEQLKLKKI